MANVQPTSVVASTDVKDGDFDAVVVVTDKVEKLIGSLAFLQSTLQQHKKIDPGCESSVVVLHCPDIPSQRLIFAPTGPLVRDYDDVRRFQDAAEKGIKRALEAGSRAPLLVRPNDGSFPMATRVALLGALHALYVPLDVREFDSKKATKADKLGVWVEDLDAGVYVSQVAQMLEAGRLAYRDIGGSDPERMAPPRVAEYVEALFQGTDIKIEVVSDLDFLSKQYPLFCAVNRAAKGVERHRARLIRLEYVGEGPIDTTLMLVGKGITYDTGGADVKVGGCMAGMHRDKCGAAFVAGFFKILSIWKPKGLKVVGAMTMVRNSIGSESYVADEIIIARSGKRVRVGNTDAEGRMVMADLLCEMKEKAPMEVNPSLFTIATLTGHVIRAFGETYSATMDNGPAKKKGTSHTIAKAGEISGDPFEISTIRREDYKHHSGRTESEDVFQSAGGGSTNTARGHQKPAAFLIMASGLDQDYEHHSGRTESEDVFQSAGGGSTQQDRGHQAPAAFLIMASGIDKHGIDSDTPLKYTHLDIAGSSGPYPGIPTGAPLVAMATNYVLKRDSSRFNYPGDCILLVPDGNET